MFSFFKTDPIYDHSIILGQGDDVIEVIVKRNARAKNIKIKITAKKMVELVLPMNANFHYAHKFVIEKERWIRERLKKITPIPEAAKSLKVISILGEEYEVILNNQDINVPIKIQDHQILISHTIKNTNIPVILSMFLKKIAKLEITKYTKEVCEKMGLRYNKISIRDTVSRWGSCSQDKNLSFSWRLVLAPRNVMEYVVVHEICHLIEMNHSPKFWNLVYKTCSNYFDAKIWLKKNGRNLHNLL